MDIFYFSSRSRPPSRSPRFQKRIPVRSPKGQRPAGVPSRLIGAGIVGIGMILLGAGILNRAGASHRTPLVSDSDLRVLPTEIVVPATPEGADLPAETPVPSSGRSSIPPEVPQLQQVMLALINEDRRANGLSEVAWDSTAATAGIQQAQEMVRSGYLSHWNLEGYGPDIRYSLAGGLNSVTENLYYYTHTVGAGPVSSEAWVALIRAAQMELMRSPGHRENILAPEHTHVGIGIAYEPFQGRLALAQEFVNQYVRLQPLPSRLILGQEVELTGRFLSEVSDPCLDLAYEPFPEPQTVAKLRETSIFISPAASYQTLPLELDSDGRFQIRVSVNNDGKAGLYHFRLFATRSGRQVLTADIVIPGE